MVAVHAIDNPDSSDFIAEFKSRSIVHEKVINNPKNTNCGYLMGYDDRIFID